MDIKETRLQMIRDLMNWAGLDDWTLTTHKGRKYARNFNIAWTHYSVKTISFSKAALVNLVEDEVLDTAMHEIAHALVGPNKGHNWVWKRQAEELYAQPTSNKKQVAFWRDNCMGIGHRI